MRSFINVPMYRCTNVPMEQPDFELEFNSELRLGLLNSRILSKNLIRSSRWGQSILTRDDVKLEPPNF